MINRSIKILLFIVVIHTECFGQDSDPGPGYQMILINNPAFSGSEGDGALRLSYLNFFPGNNYNLHSVYLSYDSYFTALHGGAGFYLTDDYLGGIINDLRGGFSYSYFLKAGKELYINAGLSGSVYHRGFNFSNALLPEQIDPLGGGILPASEILSSGGRTVFDIGAGLLFISGKIFGGFSVNHLSEPDLSLQGYPAEKLKRKLLLNLAGDFNLNRSKTLKIRPQAYMGLQGDFYFGGAGVVLESEYLSVNSMLLADNAGNINNQSGFSIKIGNVLFFYNYRFNIISGNDMLPLSLLHQTGLSFTLTAVDKRNAIKTINFPKL